MNFELILSVTFGGLFWVLLIRYAVKRFRGEKAERSDLKEQKKEKIIVHESQGKWVTVYEIPSSEGWECSENHSESEDFFLESLKYVNTTCKVMTLMAKRYRYKDGSPKRSMEDYRKKDWKEYFKNIFQADVSCREPIETTQLFMSDKKPAIEIQGQSNNIVMRERYSVHNDCEYIVTAVYSEDIYPKCSNEINKWFEEVAFRE